MYLVPLCPLPLRSWTGRRGWLPAALKRDSSTSRQILLRKRADRRRPGLEWSLARLQSDDRPGVAVASERSGWSHASARERRHRRDGVALAHRGSALLSWLDAR